MWKSLILIGFLLSGSFAWSHGDDHDHEELPVLFEVKGLDKVTDRPCFLRVHEIGIASQEPFTGQDFALVSTSYGHGKDKPAPMYVYRSEAEPQLFKGTGENGFDNLVIELPEGGLSLEEALLYDLAWWHGNGDHGHPHENTCLLNAFEN